VAEILYRQYRDYVANRIEVNNAMMALLAGSRLAAHTLQLTAGSTATLSQLFPAVEHVDRFNLRSDSARQLLHDADRHIASVAIPYALATHEDFVTESLDFLKNEDRTLVDNGKQIRAWNMHEVLFDTCSYTGPADWMQTFHVLRETRNCIIHTGGAVQQSLNEAIAAMGPGARAGWQRLNLGANPEDIVRGGRLALTAEHVFTAFAVTKRIGREVNSALAREMGSATWARVAVEDFAAVTTKTRNSSGWRRSMLGYVRQYYAEASLTEAEVEKAARDMGAWTIARWV
jgi:hypothetical protein